MRHPARRAVLAIDPAVAEREHPAPHVASGGEARRGAQERRVREGPEGGGCGGEEQAPQRPAGAGPPGPAARPGHLSGGNVGWGWAGVGGTSGLVPAPGCGGRARVVVTFRRSKANNGTGFPEFTGRAGGSEREIKLAKVERPVPSPPSLGPRLAPRAPAPAPRERERERDLRDPPAKILRKGQEEGRRQEGRDGESGDFGRRAAQPEEEGGPDRRVCGVRGGDGVVRARGGRGRPRPRD